MLNTYVKNKGVTKTLMYDSETNKNTVNEIKWDVDYDGEIANLFLDINDNNKNNHIHLKMDNDDLATIFNLPTIDMSLDKRLQNDLLLDNGFFEPKMIHIHKNKNAHKKTKKVRFHDKPFIKEFVSSSQLNRKRLRETKKNGSKKNGSKKNHTHLSSPLPGENLILPLKSTFKKSEN
jgi:hypothetical protein